MTNLLKNKIKFINEDLKNYLKHIVQLLRREEV